MKTDSRAMKRFLFVACTSILFVPFGAGAALADNGPHVSTAFTGAGIQTVGTDRCASCHRAHTSKAPFNLLSAQPDMCYTCHGSGDTGGLTDVADGIGKGVAPGALRAGGFQNAALNAAAPVKVWVAGTVAGTFSADPLQTKIGVLGTPEATTSAHNVTGTAGIAWGNGAIAANGNSGKSITLECGSCHDPHGNGNYRILRPIPVDSTGNVPFQLKAAVLDDPTTATVNEAVPAVMSTTAGIKIPDAPGTDAASRALTHVYTTTNYWLAGDSNVPVDTSAVLTGTTKSTDIKADGYINNIAAWCTTCHTRYLATSGSHKTDSGDATFTYRHRSDVNYKGAGANCVTCHVAHGTNAKMTAGGNSAGVSLPNGQPAVGLNGAADSRLLRVDNRGICLMCHNE
jgi:predicted CXXCH cytochrome family protein